MRDGDCRETNKRYRYDHVKGRWVTHEGRRLFVTTVGADDLQAALQNARYVSLA